MAAEIISIWLNSSEAFFSASSSDPGGSGGGGGCGVIYYTYTLTFNTGGGSAIDSFSGSSGTKVDLSAYVPIKDGFVFDGWYADEALAEKITSVELNKYHCLCQVD